MNPTESLSDWITPRTIAAKYLPTLSLSHIERMCRNGVWPSAHKPGGGLRAHWRILRSEVIAHKLGQRAQILAVAKDGQ
jgi:hypothetical protein